MIALKPGEEGGGARGTEEDGGGEQVRGRGAAGKNGGVARERGEKSMPLGNCILQRYFVH